MSPISPLLNSLLSLFLITCMCVAACRSVHRSTAAQGGRVGRSSVMELKSQVVVSRSPWALGSKPWCPAKAVRALHHCGSNLSRPEFPPFLICCYRVRCSCLVSAGDMCTCVPLCVHGVCVCCVVWSMGCVCVCRDQERMWTSLSITLSLIELRQGLSPDLELGWQPATPGDPSTSDTHTSPTHRCWGYR